MLIVPIGAKIAIIGVSSAGKSTIARRLNLYLHLPLYHTDSFSWQYGWGKPRSNDEIVAFVDSILEKPEWLIEGYLGYVELPDKRLQAADKVIVLDYSRFTLAWHFLKRRFSYRNKNRPELPDICTETFGLKAIIRSMDYLFESDLRVNLYNWIENIEPEKMLIFKKPSQLNKWLGDNFN